MKLYAAIRQQFWWLPVGRVPELSPNELHERLCGADPPQLLDVRSASEWQRAHIAGTLNSPINELPRRLATLALDPERPIAVICLSAHRSIPAVRLLRAQGYPKTYQLAGGMRAWHRANLPSRSH